MNQPQSPYDLLSPRQQELLDFLIAHQEETGFMPSSREIQEHFGFASQTAAMNHLRALQRKGIIQRGVRKARAVSLSDTIRRQLPERPGLNPHLIDIPIFGHIPAGMASLVEQESDGCITVDISTIGIPRNARTFALRVRGDSMIDAHIVHGDIVIMEFKEPRPKDIVAALIDGETTLKRYVMNRGKPFLKAENPKYPNLIPAHELVIQGVMLGLVRGFGPAARSKKG